MSIQSNINTMIGTAGGAFGMTKIAANQTAELKDKMQNIKYKRLAGAEEGKFLSNVSPEAQEFIQSNPEVRAGLQDITNRNAELFKHEAMATDAAEKDAKIGGIISTEKSRGIRSQGLERKEKNLGSLQQQYQDYLDKAMEAQWSMTNSASEKFVAKAAPAIKRAQLEGILESDTLSDPSKRMYYAHRG